MKFVRFEYKDNIKFGILDNSFIKTIDISLNDIVKGAKFNYTQERFSLNDIKLLAPFHKPDADVICLGVNYIDHAKESAKFKGEKFDNKREFPVYFSKRINSFVSPNDKISSHSDITNSLDYEVEICAILGKTIKNFNGAANECVFGYTVLNDITARDIQKLHKQWYYGKSLDNTCAIGPCVVSSDELDISSLNLKSFVNGELRQNSNTNNMIFDIDYVLHELSKGMTLEAGTMISLGTPSGVGAGFEPPRFLKSGDEIVCEIEGIGRLINFIN